MKDIGTARKKKGNYGRTNIRQYPVFEETVVPIRSSAGVSSDSDPTDGRGSSSSPDTLSYETDPTDVDDVVPREEGEIAFMYEAAFETVHSEVALVPWMPSSDYQKVRARFGVDVRTTKHAICPLWQLTRASDYRSVHPNQLQCGQEHHSYLVCRPLAPRRSAWRAAVVVP